MLKNMLFKAELYFCKLLGIQKTYFLRRHDQTNLWCQELENWFSPLEGRRVCKRLMTYRMFQHKEEKLAFSTFFSMLLEGIPCSLEKKTVYFFGKCHSVKFYGSNYRKLAITSSEARLIPIRHFPIYSRK